VRNGCGEVGITQSNERSCGIRSRVGEEPPTK
jgi:hypothetical protein